MINDLTHNGISLNKRLLFLRRTIVGKVTTDSIFRTIQEPSYIEYMSPFHTGTQQERLEKRMLEQEDTEHTDVAYGNCPVCGRRTILKPWCLNFLCSECSLEIVNVEETTPWHNCSKPPRDRTQIILDIINRSH